jgi:hypothetical protein
MNTQTEHDLKTQDKTPYQTPELIDYGWIENITLSGATSGSDLLSGSGIN